MSVVLHGPAGLSLTVTQGARTPGSFDGSAAPAYLGGLSDQSAENNTGAASIDLEPYFMGANLIYSYSDTGGQSAARLYVTGSVAYADTDPLPEGTFPATVRATDSITGLYAEASFDWIVTPVTGGGGTTGPLTYNGGLPSTLTPADMAYDWSQHISGPGPVAYGATGLPSGVSIDAATGAITGTWTGTASATLTAGNGTSPDVSAGVTFSA
ncbi:MAG: hypothetical protein ACK5LJ_00955 [Paracoccus sp. (in: a-proteobacteria)]